MKGNSSCHIYSTKGRNNHESTFGFRVGELVKYKDRWFKILQVEGEAICLGNGVDFIRIRADKVEDRM